MSEQNKSIKEVYDEGIQEVQKILFSIDSTSTQIKVAKQSLKDLTAMLLAHTLKNVEGRTALLSGLIVELNEVTKKVQVKPPYTDSMKNLTGIVQKAQKLLTEEKKNLI